MLGNRYVVVPTSNIDYQSWQIRLLHWSKQKVKQPGEFLILNCEDIEGREWDEYEELGSDVRHVKGLPNWAKEWTDREGEWWGGIPNKYNSLKWMCEQMDLNDNDQLLFVDPDMIFLEPIREVAGINEIIGCKWYGYQPLKDWPDQYDSEGFMYPFIIRFDTLKRIVQDYCDYCIQIRRNTNQWVSEMWALDYAAKKNGVKITFKDLAHCTPWWRYYELRKLPKMIHFPNPIEDGQGENIWFKQDFTTRLNEPAPSPLKARTEIGQELLFNVQQWQGDYLYWLKYDTTDILRKYNGLDGFLVFKPWPGGFNNIRMSLELAVALAYLSNRTLVLPPTYSMYLLEGDSNLGDFFDLDDLGIETIAFEDFCGVKGIDLEWDAVREVSNIIKFQKEGGRDETSDVVINFEHIHPPDRFRKWKRVYNWTEVVDSEWDTIMFDGNLLGNFYQVLYTKHDSDIKQLIARHVHYRVDIMDFVWRRCLPFMYDDYYAIHVRRNDFQYENTRISCEEILDNIRDRVPPGSNLYIATDHNDRTFFDPLDKEYSLTFFGDLALSNVDYNLIPLYEQLICSRAKTFIGQDYSTLSSMIYRLRGYMDDIKDKGFHVNTYPFRLDDQCTYDEYPRFIGNWHREFKDAWSWEEPSIFVSIASYRDSQIWQTVRSAMENASNPQRVHIGICLQDEWSIYEHAYDHENVKTMFVPYEGTLGVVWARNEIIKDLYADQDYYLCVDSHTRFKKDWDRILVNQHYSLESDKAVISTYPNEFKFPDPTKEYLSLPYNAPLRFDKFFDGSNDNRYKTNNQPPLTEGVTDSHRVCAGFVFAPAKWLQEVQLPDEGIVYNGEEDYLTYASYLKGWDIKCTSEAVVWHNYDYRDRDGVPYRIHAPNSGLMDNAVDIINDLLHKQNHHIRTVEELEVYLGVKFKNG